MRRRLAEERGAAIVELSLVLPVLLLAIVGVWTLLWLTAERAHVSGLARDAARYASIAHDPFCDEEPCATGYPSQDEVRAYVVERGRLDPSDPIAVELGRATAGGPVARNERFTVTVRRPLPNPFRPLAGLFGIDEVVYGSTVVGRAE